jgi:hypothetical protein
MSPSGEFNAPAGLVAAAIRAAEESGKDVAEVPAAATALMAVSVDPAADLERTVADIHRAIAVGLTRRPQVAPALFADLLGNPNGAMAAVLGGYVPQAMAHLGGWLSAQVTVGRICDIPTQVLLQMLIGPVWAHPLMRPAGHNDSTSQRSERG